MSSQQWHCRQGEVAHGSRQQQQLVLRVSAAAGRLNCTETSQHRLTLPWSHVPCLPAGKVDWDLVDEELERIPVEFKDARFDSLRHVLNILSAVDAEGAVEEVLPAYTLHS